MGPLIKLLQWLKKKAPRLVAFSGLVALSVMDVAFFTGSDLINGFWEMDKVQGFHLALWVAVGCFLYFLLRD